MDLNLLFDSIDEDIVESLNDVNSVGKSITINSYNVPDVEDFDIAIIGVTDVRGTKYKGDLEKAPFFIRSKLYDLKKDLGETNNLWSQHPEVVARLSRLLAESKRRGRSRTIP
mgnify:CR=1 FL=1